MAALIRILLRLSPRVHTVRVLRSNAHKTDDLLKNEAVQRHIKRVIDEQKAISSRLESGQVTESDRRALNLRLVEVMKVVKAFERTRLALGELAEIQTLIHSESSSSSLTNDRSTAALPTRFQGKMLKEGGFVAE